MVAAEPLLPADTLGPGLELAELWFWKRWGRVLLPVR